MMNLVINGHKVERRRVTSSMDTLVVGGGKAQIEQVHMGLGRVVMTGWAWDKAQLDLLLEVFPNLETKPDIGGRVRLWADNNI